MSEKRIRTLSSTLGITTEKTIRKATEIQQLMDIRVGSSSLTALGLTGSCPMVICLDLAAAATGHTLNKPEAVRLSGVNKKVYNNGLKAIESMLELQKQQTIKDLGVQFGCPGAISLAEETLKSYEDSVNKKSCAEMDFTAPMFQASALYCACKTLKLKIDKSKILEMCSIKRTTFDKLVTELEKHAKMLLETKKVKLSTSKKRPLTLLEDVERYIDEEDKQNKQQKLEEDSKDVDYNEWKKKMLEKASRARAMQANLENSPSSNKTLQESS